MSIINSSQGGGGLFMHGWNQNLEIANNRISGNHGTLAGGINLGNGETPPIFLNDGTICGGAATPLCPPSATVPAESPDRARCGQRDDPVPAWNVNEHVHHNMITNNASIGDALFSGTPSGAGAITVSAGADNYRSTTTGSPAT